MTTTTIRIGSGQAYPLLSGGWMCTRPGDAFPVWRHDEQDAARLLRSWLLDFPANLPGFDRLDGAAPRALTSRAPGSPFTPPEVDDPGASNDSRAAAAVGSAARVNPSENGTAA